MAEGYLETAPIEHDVKTLIVDQTLAQTVTGITAGFPCQALSSEFNLLGVWILTHDVLCCSSCI